MDRSKPVQNESFKYSLKPIEWAIDQDFSIEYSMPGLVENGLSVTATLTVGCEIISPQKRNIEGAIIEFVETDRYDGVLKRQDTEWVFKRIGEMKKVRGKKYLIFYIRVPSNFIQNTILAFSCNKIKRISITGNRSSHGIGEIHDVNFKTEVQSII